MNERSKPHRAGGFSDRLRLLHRQIDDDAGRLERVHAERLRCRRGCNDCCVDEITVFAVEADRIRERHPELLASGTPHAVGACAFLDHEGACRIYEDRPYVCRTQGLPLRWLDEDRGQTVELRDICPLNEEGPAIETLAEEACWTLGPYEGRLAALQAETGAGMERVPLRSLFTAPGENG